MITVKVAQNPTIFYEFLKCNGLPANFMKRILNCSRKQFSSISQICFGVGAGAVQTLEGLVQNRNDPPLFLQRR